MSSFPRGFLWGVATSAFQIEGEAGGRAESVWDRYCATPGKIEDGRDARVACDHATRWREDLALLGDLGVNAYRFSVAWPRVLPEGRGAPRSEGLDFYERLVDALLERGVKPFLTLNHWDLPQALQDRGGWIARDTASAFVDFAHVVSKRLGDRVAAYVTHNEPWCVAHLGHEQGAHAPGLTDPAAALRVAHHLLLSHGWALRALKANAPKAEVGIVLNLVPAEPHTQSAADLDAARWFDGFFNRWYLDPLYGRGYPLDAVVDRVTRGHLASGELPFVLHGDLATIATPTDFLGVNYYSPAVLSGASGKPEQVQVVPAAELTEMGWEVRPAGLEALLARLQRDYAPGRIYITENGIATPDVIDGGAVRDSRREQYLLGHLHALKRAMDAGAPVAGYFHWSLLDNFEWAHGYTKRFGLYHVDFATQRRTAKASARLYREIATTGVLPRLS